MIYSERLENNLGVIFRKEYIDLKNSTVKDFERYTGREVKSDRSVLIPETNSEILFMHLEEINNIQNINLGWFAIEQGDELESDHEFFFLLGRLRRSLKMNPYFAETGLPLRSGFVIGNAGDHWGKKIWKDGTDPDFPCYEANTYDMKDILPEDYYTGLLKIKERRPEIFSKYVMNDWNVQSVEFTVIKAQHLQALIGLPFRPEGIKRIVSCDPALGGDECVIKTLENGREIDQEIMYENDETKIAAQIAKKGEDFDVYDFVVDTIGIGHGVAMFLNTLVRKHNKTVYFFNSSEKADEPEQYFNKKAEVWFEVSKLIMDKKVPYPEDEETRRQLTGVRYEPVFRKGRVKIEDKQITKKRLKCSPDRAEAWVQGVYYSHKYVDTKNYQKKAPDLNRYKRYQQPEQELGIVNY